MITLFLTLLTLNASAHLKNGFYAGETMQGEPCSVEVKGVTFANNLKHPLNERALVIFKEESFTLVHMPLIDFNKSAVLPQKDFLTGVNAHAKGANALQIKMVHSEEFDGPVEFKFASHDYKNPSNNSNLSCLKLKHIE